MNTQLDEQITSLQNEIVEQKRAKGGASGAVAAPRDTSRHISKSLKMIESRLERANQKYNESLACNSALREQIDALRRERVVFETAFSKLEKELGVKRQSIARLVESVGSVYEQRDLAL